MIEQNVLASLLHDEEYARRVLPFLQTQYFREDGEKTVLSLIQDFVGKYNKLPTVEAMAIDLSNTAGLSEPTFQAARDFLEASQVKPDVDRDWLVDQTEKFCQDRAIHNAILESMNIIGEKQDKGIGRGAIPTLLAQALAVSFDTNIGHDFLGNWEDRFEFYHKKEERIPFDVAILNEVTKGGFPKKTLNCVMAATGVGKSLVMCHMAAANLAHGDDVLYITMEMAEEKIAERIDANLLDTPIDELMDLQKNLYEKKIQRIRDKTKGRLIIKEFPTGGAHVGHFRHLLHELKLKKNFVPKIIYIDYLNICASSRLKGKDVNSYTLVKTIAEELRGLAVEMNLPIMTATQTNRGGFDNSDISMTDTSESFGLPMTLDWFCAIVSTEELAKLGQFMFIQLKSRYDDINKLKRFIVGVARPKMRLYDVEQSAQAGLSDDDDAIPDKPLNRFGSGDRKLGKNKHAGFDFGT